MLNKGFKELIYDAYRFLSLTIQVWIIILLYWLLHISKWSKFRIGCSGRFDWNSVSSMHGNIPQKERNAILTKYFMLVKHKCFHTRILIFQKLILSI